jgi:hypothetical protein
MIALYLAGEGPSELGSRSGHPAYQSDEEPGVVVSLLRAVRSEGWKVVGSVNWKDIRKLRVNAPGEGDRRNVLAATLKANEVGADVLAFTRDRDRDEKREEDIEAAVGEVGAGKLGVIGGVAVETIEAWLLALRGEARSEDCRHPEKEMARLGLAQTADYVRHIPADADSLKRWLGRARKALAPTSPP